MEPFFETVLREAEQSLFLRKVIGKYHYNIEDLPLMHEMVLTLLPAVKKEAAWEWIPSPKEGEYYVLMTLGTAFDRLQERYADSEKLVEAYMMEVLAGEILLKGYEAFNRYVEMETGKHVERYYFLGSDEEHPLEQLPELLKGFRLSVCCNQALIMIPKKSVLFVAKLTEDAHVVCPGICVGCGNKNCPNRMNFANQGAKLLSADQLLNYGFGRIFKKQ